MNTEQDFLNNLTLGGMSENLKNIRETKNGKHFLKSIESHTNKKNGSLSVKFDFVNNLNPEMGIDDYLRTSNYRNLQNSFQRLRYLMRSIATDELFFSKAISEGKVPEITYPIMTSVQQTANVGEEPQTVQTLKYWELDCQALYAQAEQDFANGKIPEGKSIGDRYAKLKALRLQEIRSTLDADCDLIKNPSKDVFHKVQDENGVEKEVISKEYYIAMGINSDKVPSFVNAIVELMQPYVNKFVILEVGVDENSNYKGQKIKSYKKDNLS